MDQAYSTQLFSPAHPANQPMPTPHCCLDAHRAAHYVRCADCWKREPKYIVEDDWDKELSVLAKPLPTVSHKMSDAFEGPLWE